MKDITPFKLGETAYCAYAGQRQIWIDCPECMTSGRLRVILGDGTEVSIACICCERGGWEGSPGKISTYDFVADVETVTITGIEAKLRDGVVETEYRFAGHYGHDHENLFHDIEDAKSRAKELAIERGADELQRLKYREKQTHTWAWNVSYWRGEIRRAKQTIADAEARLAVAPKNIKEADKVVKCSD